MRFPVFLVIGFLVALPSVSPGFTPPSPKGDPPTSHQVTLAWDPSPDPSVAGYFVYVGVSGPLRPQAFDAGNNTVFTATDLEAGVTYTFFVTAYDGARNESDPSNSLEYTPDPSNAGTPPIAPSELQASLTGPSQITLTWTDNAGNEDGSRIERSLDGINFLPIATVGPNVTQFVVNDPSGFPAGTYPYWFRVASFTGDAISPYSDPACAITNQADLAVLALLPVPATPVEGIPVQFQATIQNLGSAATPQGVNARVAFTIDGGAAIGWADNTNSLAPGQTLTLTANSGDGMPLAWTATAGFHTLLATVDDLGLLGESNTWNNSLSSAFIVTSTNPPVAPNAPSGLQAALTGATQITLTWTDNATNEDGFRIERSLDGLNFLPFGTVGPNVTQFEVDDPSGFPAGTYPYWFRVASFNRTALSPYSNPACAIANQSAISLLQVVAVPKAPMEGAPVQFLATIRNVGGAATPHGINARLAFSIDGGAATAWADNTNSLAPGQTMTLTANAGAGSQPTWTATAGFHMLSAKGDDSNLPGQSIKWNNSMSILLLVSPFKPPQLSISLDRTNTSERDPTAAVFTITRAGNLDSALTVRLGLGGTARNGWDYSPLADTAWIPPAAGSITIAVTPIDDVRLNPPKTLAVSLAPSPDYQLSPQSSATLTITDSDVDSDGDGMSDRAELLAGTDPQDPASNLRILSLAPQPDGSVVVTWSSVPGYSYQLLASESLAGGNWTAVSSPVVATGPAASWTDAPANHQRFYQVSVVPESGSAPPPGPPSTSGGSTTNSSAVPGPTTPGRPNPTLNSTN